MTGAPEPLGASAGEAVPLDRAIGRVVRLGVLLALILIVLGLLVAGVQGLPPFATGTATPRAILGSGDAGPTLLFAGLVVLVVTPVVRVALYAGLFARGGDRTYTFLNLLVLAVLLATVVVGALA